MPQTFTAINPMNSVSSTSSTPLAQQATPAHVPSPNSPAFRHVPPIAHEAVHFANGTVLEQLDSRASVLEKRVSILTTIKEDATQGRHRCASFMSSRARLAGAEQRQREGERSMRWLADVRGYGWGNDLKDPFLYRESLTTVNQAQSRVDMLIRHSNHDAGADLMNTLEGFAAAAEDADTAQQSVSALVGKLVDHLDAAPKNLEAAIVPSRKIMRQATQVLSHARQNVQTMQALSPRGRLLPGEANYPQAFAHAQAQLAAATKECGASQAIAWRKVHDALDAIAEKLKPADDRMEPHPFGAIVEKLCTIELFLGASPATRETAALRNAFAGIINKVTLASTQHAALNESITRTCALIDDIKTRTDDGVPDSGDGGPDAGRLKDIEKECKAALHDCTMTARRLWQTCGRIKDDLQSTRSRFDVWLAQTAIDAADPDNTRALLLGDVKQVLPFFEEMDADKVPGQDLLYKVDDPRTMDRVTMDEMVVHAVVANSLYRDGVEEMMQHAEGIVGDSALSGASRWTTFFDAKILEFGPHLTDFHALHDGRMIHTGTRQVAQLWRNDERGQIIVGFGGSSAGEVKGGMITRTWGQLLSTAAHWMQNIAHPLESEMLGGAIPHSYPIAAELVGAVRQWMNHQPDCADYSVSVTGHSKGADEAFYAAMMVQVPGFCFCTPALGETLFNSIPPEKMAHAPHLIRHFLIEGDIAPELSSHIAKALAKIGIQRNTYHAGLTYVLPRSERVPLLMGVGPHEYFHDCVMDFSVEQKQRLEEEA